ncbi:hypothetical protein SS50377_24610 [Spironucleus salmonicida]|uniref:Thioredoxin domain-containing protein n=1 Tax=Spironucleus salmonicida TaxID=348837 RepID=V6LIZ2_9EUKA|nr:hypothetical protein SS50377_24610 [Spironucleus salmonicida]|eukprot:EST44537.1 hypothetical protein SS50377_15536 [Spironucleus salmonicida]
MILLLQLAEISPQDLDPKFPLVILFAPTPSEFPLFASLQIDFPSFNFTFLNTTLHSNFTTDASITIPSIAIHSAIGVQFLHDFSLLETALNLAQIDPNFDSSFLVTDETDLLLAVDQAKNTLVFYAGNKCEKCSYFLLMAVQAANLLNRTIIYINCDESRDLTLLCSRQSVRSYPWIQVTHSQKLISLSKEISFDSVVGVIKKIQENTLETDQVFEEFTIEWMEGNKTKFGKDGRPLEYPVKPCVSELIKKIESLEKTIQKLN